MRLWTATARDPDLRYYCLTTAEEKTERDGKDGAARGGEADLSRLERFDRMQKIKWKRSRISREDYAANLRGFSRPVGVANFVKSHAEEGSKKRGFILRTRPVKFMAFCRTLRQPGLPLESKSRSRLEWDTRTMGLVQVQLYEWSPSHVTSILHGRLAVVHGVIHPRSI